MLIILIAALIIGALFALGLHTHDKVRTEIEIEASADEVWQTLTDFDAYSEWNPFITRASGELKVGTSAEVTIALPFSKSMNFNLEILSVDSGKEFVWAGTTLEPKVLDGIHSFHIETLESGKVKFVQEEKFSGILLYIVLPFIKGSVDTNFKIMNKALKNRAERTATIHSESELQSGAV